MASAPLVYGLLLLLLLFTCRIGEGRSLRPDPIRSIEINGDVFDCVDIYKQPAFDHPLLKDHELQLKPSSYPNGFSREQQSSSSSSSNNASPLLFNELVNGSIRCPEGTVPIFRANQTSKGYTIQQGPYGLDEFTHWALMGTEKGMYQGAVAFMTTYGLPQVGAVQYSSSLVRVLNSYNTGGPMSFVQAGWMVNPFIFGDTNTRLFGSWSPQFPGYDGCYNLLCPGFVQTNPQVPLGLKLEPLSLVHGTQYYLKIILFRDVATGHWWLSVDQEKNVTIGYWPSAIFAKGIELDTPNFIQYGGVVHTPLYIEKTLPPMGSGLLADAGPDAAASLRNIQYVDTMHKFVNLDGSQVRPELSNARCYNVGGWGNGNGGGPGSFLFGGPGTC